MFGGWPHDLNRLPLSEYKTLERYYFAVKDAEKKGRDGDDDDDTADDAAAIE